MCGDAILQPYNVSERQEKRDVSPSLFTFKRFGSDSVPRSRKIIHAVREHVLRRLQRSSHMQLYMLRSEHVSLRERSMHLHTLCKYGRKERKSRRDALTLSPTHSWLPYKCRRNRD